MRPRISQMLILPPYQRAGHGAELLRTVYKYYETNTDVVDMTVEDPSEDFVRLRDFVDCQRCKALPSFQREQLLTGFSDKMTKEARSGLKICKSQVRRVYEILRLQATNLAEPSEYRDYRLDVKQRLNIPYQKEARDIKKLQGNLSADELQEAMKDTLRDERIQKLEEEYRALEVDYKRVIDRLSTA